MESSSLDMNNIPAHVAIIMDGNGRWAKLQGKPRLYGHINGVESVRAVVEAAAALGVKYLTLYTFSVENWNRPEEEVSGLMALLAEHLVSEVKVFQKNNIRLRCVGNLEMLSEKTRELIDQCESITAQNDGLTLILALSYSSRYEITSAIKKIAQKVANGEVDVDSIDEKLVSSALYTAGIPDPDLLIRTSGEMRLSNFLLWQCAYTEFYFTPTLWPDFGKKEFELAIECYQMRERRFGKV